MATLLGKKAYLDLSPEECQLVNLFIHAGCYIHKELNSCSGGNESMMAWWSRASLTGPIKLINWDNSAATASNSSTARNWTFNFSGADSVKFTSLAGAIFNHEDDKKGQQDSLQTFMLTKLEYWVHFLTPATFVTTHTVMPPLNSSSISPCTGNFWNLFKTRKKVGLSIIWSKMSTKHFTTSPPLLSLLLPTFALNQFASLI